ncbi:hypothetical protein DH2020_045798 [Rehmannia glutinosa]|uniref:Uncharacterized protein n=1 Tax=Rehmannia glutinosa TaxID=99300 RepID=A0ABR0UEU2_REHGL
MEAILTDSVRNSLQHLMSRNAIFMCERLCAEFPSEKNMQLLATCYLQNNQAHCAYHILKGTQMAQCRYLFALSCFQMDLMNEAEAALSPSESCAEVPNGAAGHYLLGLVYSLFVCIVVKARLGRAQAPARRAISPSLWEPKAGARSEGGAQRARRAFGGGAKAMRRRAFLPMPCFFKILKVLQIALPPRRHPPPGAPPPTAELRHPALFKDQGGIYRAKQHIVGGFRNVKVCPKCPDHVRELIKDYMTKKIAAKNVEKLGIPLYEEVDTYGDDEQEEIDDVGPRTSKSTTPASTSNLGGKQTKGSSSRATMRAKSSLELRDEEDDESEFEVGEEEDYGEEDELEIEELDDKEDEEEDVEYTDRRQSAINHFNQALSLDPLLWAAYEELCILGAADEATSVFDEGASLCIQKQYLHRGSASQNLQALNEEHEIASHRILGSEDVSPRKLKHLHGNNLRDICGNNHGATSNQPLNGGPTSLPFYNTPSPMATQSQLSGVAPPPVCRNAQPNGPNMKTYGADNSPRVMVNSAVAGPRRKFVDEGKLRKVSERLFSDSGQRRSMRLAGESVNTNSSTSNGTSHSKCGGSKSSFVTSRSLTTRKGQSWASENADEGTHHDVYDDSRVHITTSSSSPYSDNRPLEPEGTTRSSGAAALSSSRVIDGASDVLGLLRLLGEGFRLSCLCRCQDALNIYLKLPQKHYNTGWVLSQVGKAYFEMVDYLEADRAFSRARIASPYSLEGMDIYSTVLYHLKEDMKLSYLAQELISTDRLAPQSWCAMGNCYSLQKDHETALKNFQRSVQLNSRFAYAHTLCGHEFVALEDFENGIKSYQSALRIDSRHYNAWYGLGMIYLRQEKYEFSEHHFRMAFQINPLSSVIMSYLGTALHALKRNNEALEMMERAVLADKKNPLPLYQKANILVSMENLDGALAVLEELKEYAPCESSVYALMGSIYKRRNMYDKAMLHFGLALDLKPSATDVAAIKAAIEKLHVPDEIEDDCEAID